MNYIFDLDGTLLDSAIGVHRAVAKVLEGRGYPLLDRATVTGFIGNGTAVLIEKVMAASGAGASDFTAWHEDFLAHYARDMLVGSPPFDGVPEALERLRAEGARLAVCTNKPEALAKTLLEGVGLARYFAVVVGGDSLPERKPAPEPLWHTAKALGRPVLYIGDSEVDAEATRAAAIPLVLYTKGYRTKGLGELTHIASFADYRDLPALLQSLAAETL